MTRLPLWIGLPSVALLALASTQARAEIVTCHATVQSSSYPSRLGLQYDLKIVTAADLGNMRLVFVDEAGRRSGELGIVAKSFLEIRLTAPMPLLGIPEGVGDWKRVPFVQTQAPDKLNSIYGFVPPWGINLHNPQFMLTFRADLWSPGREFWLYDTQTPTFAVGTCDPS